MLARGKQEIFVPTEERIWAPANGMTLWHKQGIGLLKDFAKEESVMLARFDNYHFPGHHDPRAVRKPGLQKAKSDNVRSYPSLGAGEECQEIPAQKQSQPEMRRQTCLLRVTSPISWAVCWRGEGEGEGEGRGECLPVGVGGKE